MRGGGARCQRGYAIGWVAWTVALWGFAACSDDRAPAGNPDADGDGWDSVVEMTATGRRSAGWSAAPTCEPSRRSLSHSRNTPHDAASTLLAEKGARSWPGLRRP